MFKYLLVILAFWCQIQGYVSDRNEEYESKQGDTAKLLPVLQTSDTQDASESKTAGEMKRNEVTMNGNTNYNVQIGHQVFYIYGEQQVKQLLSDISDVKNNSAIGITNNNNNSNSYNNIKKEIPQDYSVTPGIGAHKLHLTGITWNKARQTCVQEGGHLAIINSESEEKVLLQKLNENNVDISWLGLHDLFEESDWITVNGESLGSTGYTKWTTAFPTTEPNNYEGKQHCATLTRWGVFRKNADFFRNTSLPQERELLQNLLQSMKTDC